MEARWLITSALLTLQSLAFATECSEYADRLDTCAAYECSFTHPFTGKPMKKSIIGLEPDGKCLTHEQMPGNMMMKCRFEEGYRKEVADYIRKVQASERIETKARIDGTKTEVTTQLDGKAIEKGYCQVEMSGAKPMAPPPAKPEQKRPPKPPAPPKPPERPIMQTKPGRPDLPDLAVAAVEFDGRCRPIVTLENRGSRGVPASAYERQGSAVVQLYKDGKGW